MSYSRCRLDLEIRGIHYRKMNILKRLIFGMVLVAMETHFYVFTLKYEYFGKSFEGTLFEIK